MIDGLQIIECPRDAMQGWKKIIPTQDKIRYINALLETGFHTIDFGSFVSPRLIPQMADTVDVLKNLQPSKTKLLAIIANLRGAEEAITHERIDYLGFPFSISAEFQKRNTNSTPTESLERVNEIQDLCSRYGKELVVYMSMGFGNPYGDPYDIDILKEWMTSVRNTGVRIMSLADTVGLASPQLVGDVVGSIIPAFRDCRIGVHLHSTPIGLQDKLAAAFNAGCSRIDGAIGGIGGCPMADDALVGNMDTGSIIGYFTEKGIDTGLDMKAFKKAEEIASEIFN